MLTIRRKFFQGLIYLVAGGSLVLAGLVIFSNVPTAVDNADKSVFVMLGFQRPAAQLSFEEEIRLIRAVQTEIFRRAPFGEGIPEFQAREPADLMRMGSGLCYDRSRTFDKIFSHLGFESRHVYLLYKDNRSFLHALFRYRQPSHAVTEVRTSRGWLFVDSNTPWIAVTRKGEPVNADDVWQRFGEFEHAPEYLSHPWWAIRGLYSRKGQFYAPYIPFPQFNWPDFAAWLVKG
jgi:hypothetical protein